MHILCPHCANPIEVIDTARADEIPCPSCGSSFRLDGGTTTDWNPKKEQRSLGKFQLLARVGSGAFGTVYKARDPALDRTVAVKVPRAGNLADAADLDRFVREGRSQAQLQHPGIVPVYEVGQADGIPFLACEFVHGLNLADRLTAGLPAPREAAQLIAAVADALQYAHEQHVIHRDIKPSNIMLRGDGTPLLMDFGLAKRETAEITMTVDGQILGTPAYMSPEQARGEGHQVDARSDVYSLGVILYRMLTGVLPFRGTSRALLHQVLHDDPRPPRHLKKDVPRDLETICLKAMAREPGQRYQSAAELAADLRRYLAGEPIRARRPGLGERARKWARRRPAAAACLALGLLVVLGSAAAAFWYWDAQVRVKTEYYANFIRRWGVPEGIGRVSQNQVQGRHRTYKFQSRAGRVERVEAINGHGRPSSEETADLYQDKMDSLADSRAGRACQYEYRRDEQGRLTEEVGHDRHGEIVWIFHYTAPGTGHFTDKNGFPRVRGGSGVAYVQFTWSEAGFEKEVRYLDRNNNRRPNSSGVFGVRHALDARGLPVDKTYIGWDDAPVVHRVLKYAKATQTFDAMGNLTELTYFDVEGKPVLAADGVAASRNVFDEHGNLIGTKFLGLDGRPVVAAFGWASDRMVYDEHGNRIEWACLGLDGKPTLAPYGAAKITWAFDAQGRHTEQAWFGLDGKPAEGPHRPARKTFAYDERGNLVDKAWFAADGRPMLIRSGYARMTTAYDPRGNVVAEAYYGETGKPIRSKDGGAKVTRSFDEASNELEWACYDEDGKPAVNKQGVHKTRKTFDERSNLIAQAHFGIEGKPVADADGVARSTSVFDDLGNRVETSYFGADARRTLHRKRGYAREVWTYDKDGNEVDIRYFDVADNPVKTRLCVAEVDPLWETRLKQDDILLAYDGKPIVNLAWFNRAQDAARKDGKTGELTLSRAGKRLNMPAPRDPYGVELEDRVVAEEGQPNPTTAKDSQ